jgi:hypothetical protein
MSAEAPNPKPLNDPAGLQALEAQLSALRPSAPALDRDRLMFLAGRASAEAAPRADCRLKASYRTLAVTHVMAAVVAAAASVAITMFVGQPSVRTDTQYVRLSSLTEPDGQARKPDVYSCPSNIHESVKGDSLQDMFQSVSGLARVIRLGLSRPSAERTPLDSDYFPSSADVAPSGPAHAEPVLTRQSLKGLLDEMG